MNAIERTAAQQRQADAEHARQELAARIGRCPARHYADGFEHAFAAWLHGFASGLAARHGITVTVRHLDGSQPAEDHQGVGNRLLMPAELVARPASHNAPVACLERLGALLNFYYRCAA